jgi:hypothetical protein
LTRFRKKKKKEIIFLIFFRKKKGKLSINPIVTKESGKMKKNRLLQNYLDLTYDSSSCIHSKKSQHLWYLRQSSEKSCESYSEIFNFQKSINNKIDDDNDDDNKFEFFESQIVSVDIFDSNEVEDGRGEGGAAKIVVNESFACENFITNGTKQRSLGTIDSKLILQHIRRNKLKNSNNKSIDFNLNLKKFL